MIRVEDLKKEFVGDFVFKSLKAGAVYEGGYLLAFHSGLAPG